MNFINVAGQFINLDNVTEIQEGQDYDGNWRMEVFFNCTSGGGRSSAWLKGESAHAMLAWLKRNSTDIGSPEHHDSEYREYQSAGGELGYVSWRNTKKHLAACLAQPESWFDIAANRQLVMNLESALLY